MTTARADMPKYDSQALMPAWTHRTVHALKIGGVQGDIIVPLNPDFEAFHAPDGYTAANNPMPGGYYVVYRDGRHAFMLPDQFEKAYKLREDEPT